MKNEESYSGDAEVYAHADYRKGLPRKQVPERVHSPDFVKRLILDELMFDGNSRQNLATFCQTWSEPQVHELMDACMDKNLVDKDEYPMTSEIEQRCVAMLARLWNMPTNAEPTGTSTTGSSEAAMLAGMAMRAVAIMRTISKLSTGGRPAMGVPGTRNNMLMGTLSGCGS